MSVNNLQRIVSSFSVSFHYEYIIVIENSKTSQYRVSCLHFSIYLVTLRQTANDSYACFKNSLPKFCIISVRLLH